MTAIVCVSQSWGIGRDGALLFRISADHKRFRTLTVGKTVILGHKTLDTFPGGKPLKDRLRRGTRVKGDTLFQEREYPPFDPPRERF